MAIVLFDTNILIDHFNDIEEATGELMGYSDAVISTVTWMELACRFNPKEVAQFNLLLAKVGIRIIQTSKKIMIRAAQLRGKSMTKKAKNTLPDCIIRATAEIQGRVIVTRNPSDFGGESITVRVPYRISDGKIVDIKPLLT